jgi:hypothetical protein
MIYANSWTSSEDIKDLEIRNYLQNFLNISTYILDEFELGFALGASKKDIGYWVRKNISEYSWSGFSLKIGKDINSIILDFLKLDDSSNFKAKRWLEEKYQKFGYTDIFKFAYYLGNNGFSSFKEISKISDHINEKLK